MAYNIDSSSSDCYDGTSCLINKFDIHDEKQLEIVESHISFAKASILEKDSLPLNFDFEHYKAIHKFIFGEIYDWAGTVRTVEISKKGTIFVKAGDIEKNANLLFAYLKESDYFLNLEKSQFVRKISEFYHDLNILHPFREGNGRTERIFISQLIRNAGFGIQFSDIDADELMVATIKAANGILDYLINIFDINIFEN